MQSTSTVLPPDTSVRDGSVAAKMAPVQVSSSNPNVERYLRASPFLAFADISQDQTKALQGIPKGNKTELKKSLNAAMKLTEVNDEGSFNYEICSDFHFYNFQFCTTQGFDLMKTSTFMSIMKEVYMQSLGLAGGLAMADSFAVFKHLLLKHSCQRPPFSTGVFTQAEVPEISKYVLDTFYRHYKMYTYVYVCARELVVTVEDSRRVPNAELDLKGIFSGMTCTSENEVEPRDEPLLAEFFESERAAAVEARTAEIDEERKEAQMTFEDRVLGEIARMEVKVDEKLRELDPTVDGEGGEGAAPAGGDPPGEA